MANGTTKTKRITVLYDPLCGWCYGATPAFGRLAAMPDVDLHLCPTGLFSRDGARPLAGFAAHAWANDQRIEQLSGQRFTTQYRDQVLGDAKAMLDSGPATTALTAASLSGGAHAELEALAAIQAARYVDGRDVTNVDVLADILRSVGLDAAATALSSNDAALRANVESRTRNGQKALSAVGARGVPTVIVGEPGRGMLIPSDHLYAKLDELRRDVEAR